MSDDTEDKKPHLAVVPPAPPEDEAGSVETIHDVPPVVVPFEVTVDMVRGKWCQHFRHVYSEEQRSIWCKDCGAQLDPFSAYRQLGQNYSRLRQSLRHLREQVDKAQGRLAELNRLEANTRQRIRTAQKALGEKPSVPASYHLESMADDRRKVNAARSLFAACCAAKNALSWLAKEAKNGPAAEALAKLEEAMKRARDEEIDE